MFRDIFGQNNIADVAIGVVKELIKFEPLALYLAMSRDGLLPLLKALKDCPHPAQGDLRDRALFREFVS